MRVLGIESSCDDSAVAILEDGYHVLASQVFSQTALHDNFGGVVPEIAAREHLKQLPGLFVSTLAQAQVGLEDIDVIAVTQEPGLVGSLLVGQSFARALSFALGKPLVPVNHVHAHLYGALLEKKPEEIEPFFPALGLVVSGGHTNLYLMNSPLNFQLLMQTMDDACGECFDKVAKMLQLGYPGGPEVERRARAAQEPHKYVMPKMLRNKKQLQFSYSGLKTHVLYFLRDHPQLTEEDLNNLCYVFQEEALGQLLRKTLLALEQHPKVRSLLVAGGVAANARLGVLLNEKITHIPVLMPAKKYCMDNAAMIAALGGQLFQAQH